MDKEVTPTEERKPLEVALYGVGAAGAIAAIATMLVVTVPLVMLATIIATGEATIKAATTKKE